MTPAALQRTADVRFYRPGSSPLEKKSLGLCVIAGAAVILTGHWATTDDMIADIAGGLMLAFGVLVLLMWSFQR
jgi:hypothetical protein